MREGKSPKPRQLGELIAEVMKSTAGPRRRQHTALCLAWIRAAGADVARRSRPVGFRGGNLVVCFESAVLRQEVEGFRKAEILDRLSVEYPDRRIANLKCVLNG